MTGSQQMMRVTNSGARWLWMAGVLLLAGLATALPAAKDEIDFQRARELIARQRQGQALTDEERQYVQRAVEARRTAATRPSRPQPSTGRASLGLTPLCDMGPGDRYKGQDGGLYGGASNAPPADHAAAARRELAKVQPLDAEGKPSPDGRIVFMSIGMSNTSQEFGPFLALADKDPKRNPKVVVVNSAFGGMDVTAWAESRAGAYGTTLEGAERRLNAAGVTPRQVQVVWLKQAKINPAASGEFPAHARKLADGMAAILNLAREKYPNLRVAYLSSRIYAGYAATPLNPEPYAYESALAVRWLIQEQIKGDAKLNCDPAKGPIRSPLLLWGPYLWADGTTPRKADGLVYTRDDLAADGTHPSPAGARKVAQMLLSFFQTDPLARTWYLAAEPPR